MFPCISFILTVVLALLFQATPAHSASAKSKSKKSAAVSAPKADPNALDTGMVRKYYLDGDFDPAIDLIETTLRYKTGFTHEDSVFMFKHLGVMYAAKYETREKGKHYMHKLLEVEPTARILDMYASDMIYMIFKNIQDEFDAARDRLRSAETRLGGGHPESGPKQPESKEKSEKKGSSVGIWIGAGAAVAVAAGAVTYFYFSDEPETVVHAP